MSDLHCPATVLVTGHGDRVQLRSLAESLRPRRVARVYTSTLPTSVASGALAAEVLAVDAVAVEGLADFCLTVAGTVEGGAALEGIVDQHPGETVLVLSEAPHPGVAELSLDADGWQVQSRRTSR